MGCDIHTFCERKTDTKYEYVSEIIPFDWRQYGMYAFLAGVRNYSAVPTIAEPRGLPLDISCNVADMYKLHRSDSHTPSWLSITELLEWDYDAEVEDRRYTRQESPNRFNGATTCEPGQGVKMTWREFLGDDFMDDLFDMERVGIDRVVFWFDS